jgi:hypothetical protein
MRYGKTKRSRGESADTLLDVFLPNFEIRDKHSIRVDAPPEMALRAAAELDLNSSPLVRVIFKGRERILRSRRDTAIRPRGLLAETKALGWGVLAEMPEREIVLGAVTKPWEPNPQFRALPPDEFAAFHEPGYVKIVWTLRANAIGKNASKFSTETRALATDTQARRKFRWYWSLLSPGIIAIRRAMLPAVKAEAERQWRTHAA